MKNVVVIGGGTGTFTVLSALRLKHYHPTALITMVDDGGSNKVLRDEFGLLPTSGVRLALVALSSKPSLLRELFLYRFHKGSGISGMTFGNLFLAAVSDIAGSQEKAIEQTSELLAVKGRVLPISYDDVRLVAQYENGLEVVGEHNIDEPQHDGTLRIKKLSTRPTARISEHAKEAIRAADTIILGPGDFYMNTIANLVVQGVVDAIKESAAHVIFILNLMSKYGEAYNYKASDYLTDLGEYVPIARVNTILINNDTAYPKNALEKYEKERAVPVIDDLDTLSIPSTTHVVQAPVLLRKEVEAQKGDTLKRSMIRHDTKKLAKVLAEIIEMEK